MRRDPGCPRFDKTLLHAIEKNAADVSVDKNRLSDIVCLAGRLDHVLSKRLRDGLAPLGMTVPHYTALSVFRALGTLSNAHLAECTMVSPQSANEMVKAMEARGWIERQPDPSHGRIIQIGLTDAGLELLQRCDAVVLQVEEQMFPDMPEDERDWLHAQLRNAVRALSVHGI